MTNDKLPLKGNRLAWICLSLILSLVSSFALFHNALNENPNFDDYSYWPDAVTKGHPMMNFFHSVHEIFYRPFQQLAIQYTVANGTSIAPLIITQILLHGLFCWLVGFALYTSRKSLPEAIVASVFMLIGPSAVYAVCGVDCIHQILCSIFGCLAVAALFKAKQIEVLLSGPKLKYIGASVLFLFLCLLSKEAAVSYFLILLAIVVVYKGAERDTKNSWRNRLLEILPYVFAVIVWLLLRRHAGGHIHVVGRYSIRFGPNVIINVVLMILGTISPAQTQHFYAAAHAHNWPIVAFYGGATICVGAILLLPLLRKDTRTIQLSLLVLGLAASSAVFPLDRISELYTYMALPYFSAAFAIGAIQLWKRYPIVAGILGAGLAVMCIRATESKILQLNDYGDYKARVMAKIQDVTSKLPQGTKVVIYCHQRTDKPLYSIYTTDAFLVLKPAEDKLPAVMGRPDLSTKVIGVTGKPKTPLDAGKKALYLDGWSGDGSLEFDELN